MTQAQEAAINRACGHENLIHELVEALNQITDVYEAMRGILAEKYPQDGWSGETMTIGKARAILARAKEQS